MKIEMTNILHNVSLPRAGQYKIAEIENSNLSHGQKLMAIAELFSEKGFKPVPTGQNPQNPKACLIPRWNEIEDFSLENWEKSNGVAIIPGKDFIVLDPDSMDSSINEEINKILPPGYVIRSGHPEKLPARLFRQGSFNPKPLREIKVEFLKNGLWGVYLLTDGKHYYHFSRTHLLNADLELVPVLTSEIYGPLADLNSKYSKDEKVNSNKVLKLFEPGEDPEGHRNNNLHKLICAMVGQGKPVEEIIEEAWKFDQKNHSSDPYFKDKVETSEMVSRIHKQYFDEWEEQRLAPVLPTITLNGRQLRDVIGDCQQAICNLNIPEPKIFLRHGKIVSLSEGINGLHIQLVDPNKMYGFLLRAADFITVRVSNKGENKTSPSHPTEKISKDLLSFPSNDLPEINFISTAPFYNEDGELVSQHGYHEKEKIYLDLDPDLGGLEIPRNPTFSQIEDAKDFLIKEVFGDFAFTSRVAMAHVIAVLIGYHLRAIIKGPKPLNLIQGSGPGVGKTLLASTISICTLGWPVDATTFPTCEAERKKMITSALIRGQGLILLDNSDDTSKVHSPSLASVVTSTHWTDRVLGQSSMVSLPNNSLWIITGNNTLLSNELSRRCINIFLDPKVEQPWLRPTDKFRHPNLLIYLKENKKRIFEAILTLIQYWINQGKPEGSKSLGSFEEWSKVIGGVLEIVGIPGFLECLQDFYSNSDSEAGEWREFVAAWWGRFMEVPQNITSLNYFCDGQKLLMESRGSGNDHSRQTKLGITLKRLTGRVFNKIGVQKATLRIKLAEDKGKHGKLYRLELLESELLETSPEDLFLGPQSQDIDTERDLGDNGDLGDLESNLKEKKEIIKDLGGIKLNPTLITNKCLPTTPTSPINPISLISKKGHTGEVFQERPLFPMEGPPKDNILFGAGNNIRPYTFIDVFSGCGGFSYGLEQAGMKCILGIDFNKDAIESFKLNHKAAKTFCGDIKELTDTKLLNLIDGETVDVVIGGPPCQGFSTAGKGIVDDDRNYLFMEFFRIVKLISPKAIVIENVKGLKAKKNKKILSKIFKIFEELGYEVNAKELLAIEYGVPQKRKRIFIVGTKKNHKFTFPTPTHVGSEGLPFATVEDAFKSISEDSSSNIKDTGEISDPLDRERLKYIPQGCGIRYKADEEKYLPIGLRYGVDWKTLPENRFREVRLQRLSLKSSSPTIMTSKSTYYHPVENRYLTPREAASIQSFPSNFEFYGSVMSVWTQIGNAVPPVLAKEIGLSLISSLEGIKLIHMVNNQGANYELTG